MKSLLTLSLILTFAAPSWGNSCDHKFMNTLSANYLTIACNMDQQQETKACDLKENYDGRKISSKRKVNVDGVPQLDLDPRTMSRQMGAIINLLLRRNPYILGAKLGFWVQPIGNACHGDQFFTDFDGQRLDVYTFKDDKYVKMQEGEHSCMADYHPFQNDKIQSFFQLTDQQRVAELKDKSTCLYYTKVNKELQRLVKENIAIDTSTASMGGKTSKSKKARQ